MGRIKQQLGGAPTIGALRRQGVIAIQVRCRRPCKHLARLELSALRLPDDALFSDVPKLRRLKCTQCDRIVAEVSPIYPVQDAPPIGEQRPAHWVLVTREADGRDGWSSPLWSREAAARFARRQIEEGHEVQRIEGPNGIIDAAEVTDWIAANGGA